MYVLRIVFQLPNLLSLMVWIFLKSKQTRRNAGSVLVFNTISCNTRSFRESTELLFFLAIKFTGACFFLTLALQKMKLCISIEKGIKVSELQSTFSDTTSLWFIVESNKSFMKSYDDKINLTLFHFFTF